METKERKLTPKQERFCEEYIVDLNATQAAIRSGYSKKSARLIGSKNITKVDIQMKIQGLADRRSERTRITADMVLKELARCAFLDPRKLFNEEGDLKRITDLDSDVAAAIAGMDISVVKTQVSDVTTLTSKIRLVDKKGVLELLGKHLALFTDRLESADQKLTVFHKFAIDTRGKSKSELEELINDRLQATRRINRSKPIGEG